MIFFWVYSNYCNGETNYKILPTLAFEHAKYSDISDMLYSLFALTIKFQTVCKTIIMGIPLNRYR